MVEVLLDQRLVLLADLVLELLDLVGLGLGLGLGSGFRLGLANPNPNPNPNPSHVLQVGVHLQMRRGLQLVLVPGPREGRGGEARDTRVEGRRQHAWLGYGGDWNYE